jgi:hypothetical protein
MFVNHRVFREKTPESSTHFHQRMALPMPTPYDTVIQSLSTGQATPEVQHQAADRLRYLVAREQTLTATLKRIEEFLKSIQKEVPQASTHATPDTR